MWQAYVNKRGPLHDGLRLEYLFARLAAHIAQFSGNADAGPKDFLRYHEVAEDESGEADISEIAKLLGARKMVN